MSKYRYSQTLHAVGKLREFINNWRRKLKRRRNISGFTAREGVRARTEEETEKWLRARIICCFGVFCFLCFHKTLYWFIIDAGGLLALKYPKHTKDLRTFQRGEKMFSQDS